MCSTQERNFKLTTNRYFFIGAVMHLVAGLKTRIMKIVREYDIKQIIEFEATDKDKRELVKEILFNQMTSEDSDKLIAEILEYFRETEEEFENRPYLLNAYKTLIESMK